MIKYVPYFIIVALLAVVIALILNRSKLKKDVDNLINSINSFINNSEPTQFSLHDNSFARLQNGIADLQELVNLERGRRMRETKKNVQFISDISHQLKTPIAGLKLYCEMDYSENPTEHNAKELELIDKMEKLVYQLMRLEKVKVDSYVMVFSDNKIEDIANKIILDFKPLFPSKNFSVKGTSSVRCDESWMSEAIANIVKNACEHTSDDGEVSIIISESGRSTLIEISDNGGGMKEEEIPNLFTRFYKAETSSSGSVGIGLAITKEVVDRHHGIISAENKSGGLTVTICLPNIDGYEAI